jgi:intracellular sulfur oxidation DsrE/DsrF family protein
VAAPQTTERELAFSLISSLSDDTKREAVRLLLRSLTNAVDEGRVSYAQIMLKVVAESSAVDAITEEARQAGANPTVKDM